MTAPQNRGCKLSIPCGPERAVATARRGAEKHRSLIAPFHPPSFSVAGGFKLGVARQDCGTSFDVFIPGQSKTNEPGEDSYASSNHQPMRYA